MLAHWWVKPGPGFSGYRALRVPELEFSHCWTGPVPDTVGWESGVSKTGVNLLVGGAGSWGGWLRCPRCLSADIGLLVGGLCHDIASCRVTVVLGLVSTHWWLKSFLKASVGPLVGGAWSQGLWLQGPGYLTLVYWPTNGWCQGSVSPRAGACPLVGRAGSQGLWLQDPEFSRVDVGLLVGGAGSLFLAVRHGGVWPQASMVALVCQPSVGRTCPTVAMGSECLNAAVLLVVGAVSLPD